MFYQPSGGQQLIAAKRYRLLLTGSVDGEKNANNDANNKLISIHFGISLTI